MDQLLIQVNANYYMMLADKYKAFFATCTDGQWLVTTIDLYYRHPEEETLGTHDTKAEALGHLKRQVMNWNSNKRTKRRAAI